ncbi:hypothetical protein M4I32_13465 [Microbacterium sp. LRZ72]|uniref:hypothetical protein n=1 Tax=Microbacterium sp. LRZ72 TaxID=2942481 RepID=UPI0029AB4AF0|nr:hypothetical protein [Microbacterium sp. LRZ72]MDX2377809.1 hypothetical protein [Microbacterium sp. LRZ72]
MDAQGPTSGIHEGMRTTPNRVKTPVRRRSTAIGAARGMPATRAAGSAREEPMDRRRAAATAGGLMLIAALAGCASAPGGEPTESRSAPSETAEIEADAAWLDEGRMIGLVTWGSSTCVPGVEQTTVLDDGTLVVELAEPPADEPCTADYAPRITLVDVPEGVDPALDLAIEVTGGGIDGEISLDGVPGLDPSGMTEYLPSAGWADEDGVFVLLTWGSSTCIPVISSVVATGPAEVTVTFETPPEDQICTMDVVPRPELVSVEGLEERGGVTAVLVGDEFDGTRIPVYGAN